MKVKQIVLACAGLVAIVGLAGLCGLCVICGCTAPYYDPLMAVKEYNDSHPGASHVTLDASSGTLGGGDVKILRSPNDTILVKVSIASGSPEYVNTRITFTDTGDDLRLKVGTGSVTDEMFNLRRSRSVIEVYLPENATYDVAIQTHSGDVSVCPLEGGSLVVKDWPYQAGTGRVTVEGGNYTSLYIRTLQYMAGSRATVNARYNSTNAYFETGPGDINIVTEQTTGRLKATTTAGSIRVKLPEKAGFTVDARARNAEAISAFTLDHPRTDKTRLNGSTAGVEAGDFKVVLTSKGGDIKIEAE